MNPRPHTKIPGTGDEYRRTYDGGMQVSGVPVKDAVVIPAGPKPRQVYPPMGPPDPQLEDERALLGAVVLGWCSTADADDRVRHIDHRRILDVFQKSFAGLAVADVYARHTVAFIGILRDAVLAGTLPPEIGARYVIGCARVARERGESHFAGYFAVGGPTAPSAGDEHDPAEDWDRSGASDVASDVASDDETPVGTLEAGEAHGDPHADAV
jgi:hypothetical protein